MSLRTQKLENRDSPSLYESSSGQFSGWVRRGEVIVAGEHGIRFTLGIPSADTFLSDGDEVEIWRGVSGAFVAALRSELEEKRSRDRVIQQELVEAVLKQRAQKELEARAFNNYLKIILPFTWSPFAAQTTEGSAKGAKVLKQSCHIRASESFSRGGIQRAQGDLLCGAEYETASGRELEVKVSCEACLATTERLKNT